MWRYQSAGLLRLVPLLIPLVWIARPYSAVSGGSARALGVRSRALFRVMS